MLIANDPSFCSDLRKNNLQNIKLFVTFQNETEGLPFPNEENEFNLPDEIFEPQASSDYNEEGNSFNTSKDF